MPAPIGEKTYYSGEKLNEFDWYDGPADELFANGILSFEFYMELQENILMSELKLL